jgi:hemoglobin
MRKFLLALASLSFALLSSTASAQQAPSLYNQLGEKAGITKVVDTFVGNIAKDARINGMFASTNIPRLKTLLVEQVCEVSGGPCKYTGRDMKSSHTGMGVNRTHFNALVEDLQAAMSTEGIPFGVQNELLAVLAPMYRDIIATK